MKIVVMTRNEWPLIKTWTFYHGKMFGFKNLYFLDGSTDTRCVEFLIRCRDEFGANVIFTQANLNEIESEINLIMRKISLSSDLMIKLDTDEFITVLTNQSICPISTEHFVSKSDRKEFDCSLDPFAVDDYLNNVMQYDGFQKKIGYISLSAADKSICENSPDDIYLFPLSILAQTSFKTFFDSRTFLSVDLGSHGGESLPPFGLNARSCDLAIIHVIQGQPIKMFSSQKMF